MRTSPTIGILGPMRLLLADPPDPESSTVASSLTDAELVALYAVPRTTPAWLRANFAMSVDGAITGSDGRSGSVNTDADHVVFELLRALSDVVVIGAGTARGEGYGPLEVAADLAAVRAAAGIGPDLPIVLVTGQGHVPQALQGAEPGRVMMATHASAPGLEDARRLLGPDHVLLCGQSHVEPASLVAGLHERDFCRVLTEGGPSLLATLIEADVVDELCVSITPLAIGGTGPRMTQGPSLDSQFVPRVLVEQDGTVMGRWLRQR